MQYLHLFWALFHFWSVSGDSRFTSEGAAGGAIETRSEGELRIMLALALVV